MKLSAVLAAIAFAPAAFAQSSSASASASASASGAAGNSSAAGSAYLQQVLGALTAANLTGLVGVASAIANTSDGMALLGQLATGNRTVFAPNDAAFSQVNSSVSSNTTLLTQILSYHILNGSYTVNNTGVLPNHTIARSLLAGSYSLPGNLTAPLVLSSNSSNSSFFQVVQADGNVTAQGPAQAANLLVYIIDTVLSLPQTVSQVAGELFPSLAGVIQQVGLLAPLESAQAITVFAPSNDAISGVQSALGSLNSTQISTILANHVINGTIVYSTGLTSANYTSAAGSPFTFMTNSSGSYVMSANSTAKIIQADIILENGVAHIIDQVLVNTNSNATAAGAAYTSNVAAQSTAAATSQASASGTSRAAAGHVAPFALTNSMVGGIIAAAGVMLGGGYILA